MKIDYKTINTGDYKYELVGDYNIQLHFTSPSLISGPHFTFVGESLTIGNGYRWDGASGPTWDNEAVMRASLIHDVLYQMLREGFITPIYRRHADLELKRIMFEDGAWKIRCWYYYLAVRLFAASASRPVVPNLRKTPPMPVANGDYKG